MSTQRDRAGLVLAVAVACLAALLLASSAGGAVAKPRSVRTHSAAAEALRFWTPARMRRARPLDSPRSGPGGLARTSDAGGATGEFTEVADATAPGFRQNGAIFFRAGFFGIGRCSGTAVRSRNRSVVITAGHCVRGFEGWYGDDWVFVPGYHDGVRPFGVFPAKWLGSTSTWIDWMSENGDVAAAVVARNEDGRRLGAAVGGYGIAFGRSPHQLFDVHGYPAEAPFDGRSQRLCAGTPYLGHDIVSFLQPGPLNLGLSCELTGGASGGGWTIEGDLLNGVTSYGYEDDPETVFSPYFGGAVRALYRRAARVR